MSFLFFFDSLREIIYMNELLPIAAYRMFRYVVSGEIIVVSGI